MKVDYNSSAWEADKQIASSNQHTEVTIYQLS